MQEACRGSHEPLQRFGGRTRVASSSSTAARTSSTSTKARTIRTAARADSTRRCGGSNRCRPATPRVALTHVDADGAGGYPGELHATATYALNDDNELTIEYRATTDRSTIANITHHSYFNLAGEAELCDVMNHRLTLYADSYTPIDSTSMPTGEQRPVADTPFDFRRSRAIGERIRDGRDAQLRFARGYDRNPDAPNHADFPSACLRPGDEFVSTMTFRFSVAR